MQRKKMRQRSAAADLRKAPPKSEEIAEIHKFFVSTTNLLWKDALCFSSILSEIRCFGSLMCQGYDVLLAYHQS